MIVYEKFLLSSCASCIIATYSYMYMLLVIVAMKFKIYLSIYLFLSSLTGRGCSGPPCPAPSRAAP